MPFPPQSSKFNDAPAAGSFIAHGENIIIIHNSSMTEGTMIGGSQAVSVVGAILYIASLL